MQENPKKAINLPKDIAARAFNMVKSFVSKTDRLTQNNTGSTTGSETFDSSLGDQLKSAVVFDLSVRDFELALQKEPLDSNILIWYGQCMYWNTRYVDDYNKVRALEESADALFDRALKGKNVTQAKVYEAWAITLQEEALRRTDWQRTVCLQKALSHIQKSYQLDPDSRGHYNSIFIKWHSMLVKQQNQLDLTSRTFGSI